MTIDRSIDTNKDGISDYYTRQGIDPIPIVGEIGECDEGTLEWVDKKFVRTLPMWEGDRIFINRLLNEEYGFSIRYVYQGDDLVEVTGTVTDEDWKIIEEYR